MSEVIKTYIQKEAEKYFSDKYPEAPESGTKKINICLLQDGISFGIYIMKEYNLWKAMVWEFAGTTTRNGYDESLWQSAYDEDDILTESELLNKFFSERQSGHIRWGWTRDNLFLKQKEGK